MKLYQNLNVTGSLTLTGSLNTVGTITATTLVVQTITSSVTAMTGSTKFGQLLTDTHQFTGSMLMTGSLAVVTNGTEFQVSSTGVNIGNALTDSHVISGSVRINPNGLFVSSSSNIGIGTNTPSYKLQIESGTNTAAAYFKAGGTSGYSSLIWSGDNGTTVGAISTFSGAVFIGSSNVAVGSNGGSNGEIRIEPYAANIMYLKDGKVGIGTTTPASRLDLGTGTGGTTLTIQDGFIKHITSGYIVGSQYFYGSNEYGRITAAASGFNFTTLNGVGFIFNTGAVNINRTGGGGILNVLGTIYLYETSAGAGNSTLKYSTSTGAVTYDTSARAYKKDIEDLNYGLTEILQMSPKKYKYKSDNAEDIGFIADEIYGIVPEIVALANNEIMNSSFEEGEPISINYDRFAPILVKAIQELKAEFDEYKTTHP
jgi:hypothetical protein